MPYAVFKHTNVSEKFHRNNFLKAIKLSRIYIIHIYFYISIIWGYKLMKNV